MLAYDHHPLLLEYRVSFGQMKDGTARHQQHLGVAGAPKPRRRCRCGRAAGLYHFLEQAGSCVPQVTAGVKGYRHGHQWREVPSRGRTEADASRSIDLLGDKTRQDKSIPHSMCSKPAILGGASGNENDERKNHGRSSPGADFAYSSTPRLGGALPRLYRTILALTSACFFFLCLSVRFMAFDEVGPARSARSLKEDVKPMDHTPYAHTHRPAVYDARCVGVTELRPCSPLDMIFRAHFSVGPGGLGSCVHLSADASQCLRGANRFRTLKDCEAVCKHGPPVLPTVQTYSNDAATPKETTPTTSRNPRSRQCDVAVSFGPCSATDRRGTIANYVFQRGRCVALRGNCTDAGFHTLRECRSVCSGREDPSNGEDLADSSLV
ncbi:hypothetical protein HPB51_002037 [Rhipicephalus microplus]|uniref:Uncharacterized protein n=1 Tax=Rhipicephalus microplus TaxID=6941 RepID=A0A9J6DYN7_RHIMP|nr:hypothetical protein HPB51_002037 [Rhipicephalus microplus]